MDQPIRGADRLRKVLNDVPHQARITPGIHIVGIAELNRERSRGNLLAKAGWPAGQYGRRSADALKNGTTLLTDDAMDLIRSDRVDLVVEATAASRARAFGIAAPPSRRVTTVMVNVEADVPDRCLPARPARA